jgi:hypothetical protein
MKEKELNTMYDDSRKPARTALSRNGTRYGGADERPGRKVGRDEHGAAGAPCRTRRCYQTEHVDRVMVEVEVEVDEGEEVEGWHWREAVKHSSTRPTDPGPNDFFDRPARRI